MNWRRSRSRANKTKVVFEKSHSGLNWRRSRGRANETTAVNATGIANVVDLTLVDNDRVDKNRGQ